ncbi:uncharacterized protein LOC121971688 isoform X1 [Zingiber officinale]|nr:uncharacterized protein LOC121971688 isoform X1 [Zingiber officinale]
MLAMENVSRINKSHHQSSFGLVRSGYEPSDTESEWQESPWHDGLLTSGRQIAPQHHQHTITVSPLHYNQKYFDEGNNNRTTYVPRTSSTPRRQNRFPYNPLKGGEELNFPSVGSSLRKNTSPLKASDHQRHISPYRSRYEEPIHQNHGLHHSVGKRSHRTPTRSHKLSDINPHTQFHELSVASGRSSYNANRSVSAPKSKGMEEFQVITGPAAPTRQRCSPLVNTTIHGQIGHAYPRDPPITTGSDVIADKNLSRVPSYNAYDLKSIDSISPGDIFFSLDQVALAQKNSDTGVGKKDQTFSQKTQMVSESNIPSHQFSRGTNYCGQTSQSISVRGVVSQTSNNSSSISQRSNGGTSTNFFSSNTRLSKSRVSNESTKFSDDGGKVSGGFIKFAINRQKNQTDLWFSCVKGASCGKSKSPKHRTIDEASYIEKAIVVEELRQFWADKHRPRSLDEFICHRQKVQQLKQLVSPSNCPHILLKGPTGSGKKSVCLALLHGLFGDSSSRVTFELKHYKVQWHTIAEAMKVSFLVLESNPLQITVPLASSAHHLELNLRLLGKNANHALMAVVKEIAENHVLVPEISDASFKMDIKVIVLYEVDKVTENVQHLVKWIMDCYAHVCKIFICCQDDFAITDSIKSRCKIISIDAPVTHEIVEVLTQIAVRESFELSTTFAARIATKCKHNIRKSIMALEACKEHNYPFMDRQLIHTSWEEILVEIAAEILDDPSPRRLVLARGKFQKLLVEFVHPKLILQKLVEELLKGVERSRKREIFYWHAYYNKRLPAGTSALMKLDEFVAKFMSIHRKSLATQFEV